MEDLISKGRVIQTRPGAVPQYKRYLDEMPGIPIQSLWDDLPAINNRSSELLGYPTQKPESLLERILNCRKANGATALFTSRELRVLSARLRSLAKSGERQGIFLNWGT
jgi:hypothetical protein